MQEEHNRKYLNIKRVKLDDFSYVWDKYRFGEWSLSKCARELGVSRPTFRKWRLELFEKNFLASELSFIEENKDKYGY